MPTRQPQLALGHHEDVVPEPGLEVALELGQVEVRAGSLGHQGPGVVEQVEAEVEERAGDRLAVHRDMGLAQVPAAGPDQERGGVLVQAVLLALGTRVTDHSADGVADVDLSLEGGVPGRGVGVLEVGHEHPRPGVERIDHHLAIDGPGDLDPAVEQVGRDGSNLPVPLADAPGLGQEVRLPAAVEPGLDLRPAGQELPSPAIEGPLELGQERQGIGREDLLVLGPDRCLDLHSRHRRGPWCWHRVVLPVVKCSGAS